MSESRRQFSLEFKREAVQLIVQDGLSVPEAARRLDVRESLLRRWRKGQITMASDSNDPNGKRRVTFNGLDGKRRTIRLGQCSEKIANDVRRHVEAINLRWSDVDWERGRLTVHSPKTEHHPGKALRQIPLFPEIRQALNERWDVVAGTGEFIFERMRRTVEQAETGWKAVNLRTQFTRILAKAGVSPWPRLWVNLRSSCETELSERYPAHVTAAWLGHTPDVAQKHYLQTLESHFTSAASDVAQNPARTLPELRRTETNGIQKPLENQRIPAGYCTEDYPARIRSGHGILPKHAISS